VDEVVEEAHLSAPHIFQGIERFVRDRAARIAKLEAAIAAVKA
jgi:hypothetical protein